MHKSTSDTPKPGFEEIMSANSLTEMCKATEHSLRIVFGEGYEKYAQIIEAHVASIIQNPASTSAEMARCAQTVAEETTCIIEQNPRSKMTGLFAVIVNMPGITNGNANPAGLLMANMLHHNASIDDIIGLLNESFSPESTITDEAFDKKTSQEIADHTLSVQVSTMIGTPEHIERARHLAQHIAIYERAGIIGLAIKMLVHVRSDLQAFGNSVYENDTALNETEPVYQCLRDLAHVVAGMIPTSDDTEKLDDDDFAATVETYDSRTENALYGTVGGLGVRLGDRLEETLAGSRSDEDASSI